jgi:hypothetical protein
MQSDLLSVGRWGNISAVAPLRNLVPGPLFVQQCFALFAQHIYIYFHREIVLGMASPKSNRDTVRLRLRHKQP